MPQFVHQLGVAFTALLMGCAVNPAPQNNALGYELVVSRSGNGTVTSSPNGINCGSSCLAAFPANTIVTLTAMPIGDFDFQEWSGSCTGSGSCAINMSARKQVSAVFVPKTTQSIITQVSLRVSSSVVSSGGTASLTALVKGTGNFNNGVTWSIASGGGDLSGISGTVATYTAPKVAARTTVQIKATSMQDNSKYGTASITVEPSPVYALSVSKTGNGRVTSTPLGIDCGADCTESYSQGTSVTLSAAPDSSYSFVGWGGACTGNGVCAISMTEIKAVTASFQQSKTTTVRFDKEVSQ